MKRFKLTIFVENEFESHFIEMEILGTTYVIGEIIMFQELLLTTI